MLSEPGTEMDSRLVTGVEMGFAERAVPPETDAIVRRLI